MVKDGLRPASSNPTSRIALRYGQFPGSTQLRTSSGFGRAQFELEFGSRLGFGSGQGLGLLAKDHRRKPVGTAVFFQ
jgi:hypothetical protein